MDDLTERRRGMLVGLAVGDALGAAVEFSAPGTFPRVVGYRGGGPHRLNAGEWTDDCSMALALADSIVANGDVVMDDIAQRFVDWWHRGAYSVNGRCFDIGVQTQSALQRFKQTKDAATSASADTTSSGNGSIMRLAPVAIRWATLAQTDARHLAELAERSSIPTHGSPICLSACRFMAVALGALACGAPREEVLAPDWPAIASLGPLCPEIADVVAGSYRRKRPPEIRGDGYVVHTLEAALWAFHDAPTFADAVLAAVNLGDDSDTTGAVCGQFAGAFLGESGIPPDLRSGLARQDMIEHALAGLLADR